MLVDVDGASSLGARSSVDGAGLMFPLPCVAALLPFPLGTSMRHTLISCLFNLFIVLLSMSISAMKVDDPAACKSYFRMVPPSPSKFKINVDGASDGNSGNGGIGVVVQDENGEFSAGIQELRVPHMRNTQVIYGGIGYPGGNSVQDRNSDNGR